LTLMALALVAVLVIPNTSAQSTAPTIGDGNIIITCDSDYYAPGVLGYVDIYCDIDNVGSVMKALKVGATFDEYFGEDVEIVEVNVDGSPVTYGLTKLPPQAQKVRDRVLSNQVVQVPAGTSKELHLKVKVPLGSSGKFDVLYGDPDLPGGYYIDPWWNATWQYKACFNFSGHTKDLNGTLAERPYGYPFNMTINSNSLIGSSKMNSDCSDVRVVFNDTTEIANYFVRDCGATQTEVWFPYNMTVGNSYDFCIYYGNPSAPDTSTDPYDIVWVWEDFENASAFNTTGHWQSYYLCQSGGGASSPSNITGGKLVYEDIGACSGNNGEYYWLDNLYFNISEVGFLTDTVMWYSVPNDGWGLRKSAVLRNTNSYHRNTVYAFTDSNVTYNRFRYIYGSIDYELKVLNSTSNTDYWTGSNTSNYYSTMGKHERSFLQYNPDTYNFTLRGNYSGQPYFNEIIMDTVNLNNNPDPNAMIDDTYIQNQLDNGNVTLEFGSSKGANQFSDWTTFEYWFARPWVDGEPVVTGGAETPLDNGTLSIDFASPTPANATYDINAPTVTINVSSNKTIYWCKLDWDGANYSMSTDTNYCYTDQPISGNHSYSVFVEDLWGYQAETDARELSQISSTALLGVKFNISDFNISSSSYVTGTNVTFNTTKPSNFILMTSLNARKESGSALNDIYARVTVDGAVVKEEKIRSVGSVGDEGSTGISPTAFNVSYGSHYIQLDFRRTGDGEVSINDFDASMGQLDTYIGGTVFGNLTSGNFTHNSTDLISAHNFSFFKPSSSDMFLSTIITIEADNSTLVTYQYQNLDNTSQVSPYGSRYLSDENDTGSLSGVFIDYFPSGEVNMTILASSSTGANVSVNYTNILFELQDNFTKTVESFQVTNSSTDNSSSLNITGWTKIAEATKTVVSGDSYFVGFYGYYQSNSGSQTVTHKINATGTTCESKKERYLSDNTDVGLTFMYLICDNLTAGNSYTFQLWTAPETGKSFDHYDESFAGFEVQSFNTTASNVPPTAGVITSPVNGTTHGTTLDISWTNWTDPDSNFLDYNLSLLNGDGTYNQTIYGSVTNNSYSYDIYSLPSAVIFGVSIEGCDDLSLCSTGTPSYFTVQNPPIYTEFASDPETTNFSAVSDYTNVSDPVLANSHAKVEWSGYGYDFSSKDLDTAMSFAYNSVTINPATIPTLDTSATVTLKGVNYIAVDQYHIYKDGALCTDCVALSASPVSFTVTGFSTYTTAKITAVEQAPILALIPFAIAIVLLLGLGSHIVSREWDLGRMVVYVLGIIGSIILLGVIFLL
jgi:hypothetical protein